MSHPRPLPVAPDVWLIRAAVGAGGPGIPLHTLVVGGEDAVLVDAGASDLDAWWAQLEQVVEPTAIRWLVASHDDPAHLAALEAVLDRCPGATVVASAATGDGLAVRRRVPAERCRLVVDGDVLPASGRNLVLARPPAYESPGTLGMFDPRSGVYWGSVCFGTAVPHEVDEVSVLDRDVWEAGFATYHLRLSPWLSDVDPTRWRAAVGRVAVRAPRTIASSRGPLIRRGDVGRALDLLTDLAGLPAPGPIAVGHE